MMKAKHEIIIAFIIFLPPPKLLLLLFWDFLKKIPQKHADDTQCTFCTCLLNLGHWIFAKNAYQMNRLRLKHFDHIEGARRSYYKKQK